MDEGDTRGHDEAARPDDLETDIWRQVAKECGLNGPLDEVYRLVADAPTTLRQAVTLSSIERSVADMRPSNKVFPSWFKSESPTVATPVAMCWAVTAQLCSNVIQVYDLAGEDQRMM
ncbi:hypothetical protein O1611_g5342 [Lasiodiplodia mahajangana]|uniref:Uncharacterized protein n=1 Tax=Lasiodiplodia mahajangana TaxID=1108764 RepID=A0ACC2JM52_9PEZI|nr:hypothetical protein O1611_g5342 [Lasiodiplodia mahajangana]